MSRFSLHRLFVALLMAAVCAALPAAAHEAARDGIKVEEMSRWRKLVPAEQLEGMAQQQYAGLKQQAQQKNALLPPNHPQVIRLREIANRLVPHAARWNERAAGWQWEINVIDAGELNAFCMPGGKIAFFTGILDKLTLTDDEVAVVMGHEMAHALREHGRERVAKSAATDLGARVLGFGLSAMLGVDPKLTDMATGTGAGLLKLRFSRDDETEADLVGLDIVARAGFDPRAGIALWQKMGAVSKREPTQWLSTHPAGRNRIAEMQKHMPDALPLYARAKGTTVAALPPYQSNVKGIAPIR